MGDAADDAFDAAIAWSDEIEVALRYGAKPCHCPKDKRDQDGMCAICGNLGWVDRNGQPFDF